MSTQKYIEIAGVINPISYSEDSLKKIIGDGLEVSDNKIKVKDIYYIDDINELLDEKANVTDLNSLSSDINDKLDLKTDNTTFESEISSINTKINNIAEGRKEFYTINETDRQISTATSPLLPKSEADTTYAKQTTVNTLSTKVDNKIDTTTANNTFATKTEVTNLTTTVNKKIDTTTAADTYATKATVNSLTTTVNAKIDKTTADNTYATKTTVNNLTTTVNAKIDTSTANSTFATQTAVNSLTTTVNSKIDSSTAASTYATKTEVSTLTITVNKKIDTTTADNTYATKATVNTLTTTVGNKIDTTTANNTFATKTEVTNLTATVGNKLDASTAATIYATKTDTTTINSKVEGKLDVSVADTKYATQTQLTETNNNINLIIDKVAVAPTYTQPTVSITNVGGLNKVGSSKTVNITLTSAQNDAGAITTKNIYKGSSVVSTSGSFTETYTITEGKNHDYKGEIIYSNGVIKNNNFGIPDNRGQVLAGSKVSTTYTISGVYPYYATTNQSNVALMVEQSLISQGAIINVYLAPGNNTNKQTIKYSKYHTKKTGTQASDFLPIKFEWFDTSKGGNVVTDVGGTYVDLTSRFSEYFTAAIDSVDTNYIILTSVIGDIGDRRFKLSF